MRPFHLAFPVIDLKSTKSFYVDILKELKNHLLEEKIEFVIEPKIRFKGEAGEQATMFFLDPSGNALEFKAFNDDNQILAK